LGKDSNAREKAVRWIIKHLNDEDDDADLDQISEKVQSIIQVIKLTVDDKVFKIINKGLDLLEQLTIS